MDPFDVFRPAALPRPQSEWVRSGIFLVNRRTGERKPAGPEGGIPAGAEPGLAPGIPSYGRGNIDLTDRPQVAEPDGRVSTVRSISVGIDGKEVLIPTVSDEGRLLSDAEAVALYRKTGRHLGEFRTPQEATAYAERLHRQQQGLVEAPPAPLDPYAGTHPLAVVGEQLKRRAVEGMRSLADLPLLAERLRKGLDVASARAGEGRENPLAAGRPGALVPAAGAAASRLPATPAELGAAELRAPYLAAKDDLARSLAERGASPLAIATTDTGLEGAALALDPTNFLPAGTAVDAVRPVARRGTQEALETAGQRTLRQALGERPIVAPGAVQTPRTAIAAAADDDLARLLAEDVTGAPEKLPSVARFPIEEQYTYRGQRSSSAMGPADAQLVAKGERGEDLGRIWYTREPEGGFSVRKVEVAPEAQRQGVARELYRAAYDAEGPYRGSTARTPDGEALVARLRESDPEIFRAEAPATPAAPTGAPPERGLVVAGVGKDGRTYYGAPGDVHFHLTERFPDQAPWQRLDGFAGPDGRYLSREEALSAARAEGVPVAPATNMGQKLDALDLNDAVRRQAREPAAAEAGFVNLAPLDDARKGLKRWLTSGGKFKVAAEDFADPAQRAFVRGIPKRIEDQGGRYAAIMYDKRLLDEELFAAVKAEKGYGKRPKQLFEDIQRARDGEVDLTTLPPRVAEAARRQFEFLDNLSEVFADSGAAGDLADQIRANKTWYHRAYQKFDRKDWLEQARKLPDWARAEEVFAKELRAAGVPEDQIRGRVAGLMNRAVDAEHGPEAVAAVGGAPVRRNDILRQRQQIDPAIRAVMGEYKDWRHTFEKSVHNLAWDLSTHEMMTALREQGLKVGVFREAKDGPFELLTKQVPSSRPAGDIASRYQLDDLLTTPGLVKALGKEFEVAQTHWWNKAAAVVSLGKTLGNFPTGYVRNFLGHTVTTAANGNVPFNPARALQLKEAWGSPPARRRMVELGITGQGASSREIEEWFRIVMDGAEGPAASALARGAKFSRRMWELGDDVWRSYNWLAETDDLLWANPRLSRVEAEALAADRVRDTFQTYSRAPEVAGKLRRTPLGGPGTTFYIESVRNVGNIARLAYQDIRQGLRDGNTRMVALGMKRALGLATVATGTAALPTASRLAAGIGEDDAGQSFDAEQMEALRAFVAPDYHRNAELFVTDFEPGKKISYYDVSFLNPYSGLAKSAIAMVRQLGGNAAWHEPLTEFLEQAVGGDVLAKSALELGLNRRLTSTWPPETGGKLDIDGRGGPDWRYQAYRRLAPGTAIAVEENLRGLDVLPQTTETGRTYSQPGQLLTTMSGFRRITMEIEPAYRRNVAAALELARDARSKARSEIRAKPPTPEVAERYVSRYVKSYERLAAAVDAFRDLGMSEDALFEQAKGSGASPALVNAALDGEAAPPFPRMRPDSDAERALADLIAAAWDRRFPDATRPSRPAAPPRSDPFDVFAPR